MIARCSGRSGAWLATPIPCSSPVVVWNLSPAVMDLGVVGLWNIDIASDGLLVHLYRFAGPLASLRPDVAFHVGFPKS